MKHLRLFKTEVEYKSATLELPNVSYVEETKQVDYTPYVPKVSQKAGDIVYYTNGSLKTIGYADWSSDLGTPVGVITIPTGFTPDGKARMMALSGIQVNWGGYGTDTILTNYTKVPITDNTGSDVGSNVNGYLPSDIFNGAVSFVDKAAKYSQTNNLIPSPYSGNKSNSEYYKEINGNNVLSDFNGLENTRTLVELDSTTYEAANYCWNYSDGISTIQWYLPACGELGYMIPRFKEIQAGLSKLNTNQLDNSGYYWSSSECSMYFAYGVSTKNGMVGNYNSKSNYGYAYPWTVIDWDYIEPIITVTYNVTKTDVPTKLCHDTVGFKTFWIDDEIITAPVTEHTFATTGEHVVKMSIIGTAINKKAFYNCDNLISVIIPDSITSIGYQAFRGDNILSSITIGSGVIEIENQAFYNCPKLSKIKCDATTAPIVSDSTFYNVALAGTLTYPVGSDYSSWLLNNEYYLGYYNWTVLLEEPVVAPVGASIYGLDGKFYSAEEWTAAGKSNSDAVGVAVSDGEHSFVIHPTAEKGKEWSYPTRVLIDGVFTTEDKTTAVSDFAGEANTTAILAAVQAGTITDAPAAQYAASITFANGKTGYLPSAGELVLAYTLRSDINSCITAIGGTEFDVVNNDYWSSTQIDDFYVWCLNFGDKSVGWFAKVNFYKVRVVSAL